MPARRLRDKVYGEVGFGLGLDQTETVVPKLHILLGKITP